MPTLHVSCAAEGGYVAHSAVLLHSVLAHRGGLDVHVSYLHGPRLESRSAELLTEMVDGEGGSIVFHEVSEAQVEQLPVHPEFTAAMWHRTFLPELLPDVDRILYMDVDAVVVDSLEPLWATDLEGHYVAAVTNVFEERFLHRPAELGLAGPEVYFNSGVLLMNLTAMRHDGAGQAVRDYAVERGRSLQWPDQDALNVVLGRRRLALHPRWNCMNSVMTFSSAAAALGEVPVEEARLRPAIRHFEGPGPNKPWHFLCEQPLRESYFQHRRQTPWPHVMREGVTPRNILKRLARVVGFNT